MRYRLEVEAVEGWDVPADRRLAKALKGLLRGHGLRAVAVERVRNEGVRQDVAVTLPVPGTVLKATDGDLATAGKESGKAACK